MIDNTAKMDPLLQIGLAMGNPDGWVEGIEAQGQGQLVASNLLPVDTRDGDQEYLDLGFSFGAPLTDDPLFRPATLPDGWSRQRSDHSMWSYLIDNAGRRRVAVFYKAAPYDRRAFMRLEHEENQP